MNKKINMISNRSLGLLLGLGLALAACAGCAPVGYVEWAVASGGQGKTPAATQSANIPDPAASSSNQQSAPAQ